MKQIVIDLGQLLEELQALDLKTASVGVLIEYQTKLEFVKAGAEGSCDIPDKYMPVFTGCLEYYDKIRDEFERRGLDFSSLWDEIAENPEILISAISSLPLMDLIAAEENLRKSAAEDPLVQPLHNLVLEILQQKLANCPRC